MQSFKLKMAKRPIQIGGGVFPKISCARGNLLLCGVIVSGLFATYFIAKNGTKRLFSPKEALPKGTEEKSATPPKVQTLPDCVSQAGTPKKPLITDMVYEGIQLMSKPHGRKPKENSEQ